MSEQQERLTLTTIEVARALGVSKQFVRMLAKGGMPHIKISPKLWLYPRSAIELWLVERANADQSKVDQVGQG